MHSVSVHRFYTWNITFATCSVYCVTHAGKKSRQESNKIWSKMKIKLQLQVKLIICVIKYEDEN